MTLVDSNLGDESGLRLAKRLAEQADGSPAPLILISAHSEDDYADLIAASPAIGFLQDDVVGRGRHRWSARIIRSAASAGD
ncbi:hypothetical protein [Kribbella pittospori]|uniref:hypothetical protein n=1 Tax=Kribbella pittospori TaxID=722689 RepID=UPI001EE10BEC|nr:hypothetical protein [Kribbella pittospori]